MRSIISAVCLTALLSTFVSNPVQAAAVPFEARALQIEKRAAPYPEDATIRKALTGFNGPSVFFSDLAPLTQAQRDAPDSFAETVQGRTVKGAFGNQPAPNQRRLFTDQWPGPGRSQNYQDFADRFSRIFAEQSKGDTAFVLLRAVDGPTGPKLTSVWNVHELPALKANPNIKKIIRVNPADFNDQQQIFPEVAATPPPADPAAPPAPAAPQLKPRRLGGGLRLGGGFKLGGSKPPAKVKPAQEVEDTPAAAPSKTAAPPPPPSSKPPPPPPPSSSKPPPPPPSSTSNPPPPPSSSSKTSAAAASSPTSSASASATPATLSSTSTAASTSSTSASSSSASITSASSTTASSTTSTTSSTTTSSTTSSFVVLDWDNPKDGPYYSALLP